MSSPYIAVFEALAAQTKQQCLKLGITPSYSGAGFLHEIWQSPADRIRTLKAILSAYPDDCKEERAKRKETVLGIRDAMDELANAAKSSKNLHDLEQWGKPHVQARTQ